MPCFRLILTAPGEEGLKAAMLYGMYIVTKSEAVSVGFSTAIWASFHTILVGFTLPEVALAFMSGLIWYGGWKYTGSLLGPLHSPWRIRRRNRRALRSPVTLFLLNLIECKGCSSRSSNCHSRRCSSSEWSNPRLSPAAKGAVDFGLQCQHSSQGAQFRIRMSSERIGMSP